MSGIAGLAAGYGIPLPDEAAGKFAVYQELLLDWNSRMNLTAITDPDEIVVKHFLDSLLLLNAVNLPSGAAIIDVGAGAGFPGVPLKLARSDLKLTLLDSLRKRTLFLEELSHQLGQSNEIIHARAEQLARDSAYREAFDVATARAVAGLPALCEYCLPFVKPGGVFAAMKGPDCSAETAQSANAIRELGGELVGIKSFSLPNDHHRAVVLIKKISQTPPKYPRTGVKIAKTPL